MKKTLLIIASLSNICMPALEKLAADKTHSFILFSHTQLSAEVSGFKDNLSRILKILTEQGNGYTTIPEASIDEFLFSHKNTTDEFYLSPMQSSRALIRSAGLLNYTGKLYLCRCSSKQPEYTDLSFDISAFRSRKTRGKKSLNNTDASFHHVAGDLCSFHFLNRNYTEIIPRYNDPHVQSGAEGFSWVSSSLPGYRIKLFNINKTRDDLEKLKLLIKSEKHPDIAFPLAIVYNNTNDPIGYLMKNFPGISLDTATLHRDPGALDYVASLLEQMIFCQNNHILHMDLDHNIVKGYDGKSHIIDIDSCQFGSYVAKATSLDSLNGLPVQYSDAQAMFHSTIPTSYTALMFSCSTFCDPSILLGIWSEKTGFCSINKDKVILVKDKCKQLSAMFIDAHTKGCPVAIVRQLAALLTIKTATDTIDHSFDHVKTDYPTPNSFTEKDLPIYFEDEKVCTPFSNRRNNDTSYKADIPAQEESYENPTIKINNINNTAKTKISKKDVFIKAVKNLLLDTFMDDSMTDTDDVMWATFCRQKLWIKPLVEAVVSVGAIGGMLAFLFMK